LDRITAVEPPERTTHVRCTFRRFHGGDSVQIRGFHTHPKRDIRRNLTACL